MKKGYKGFTLIELLVVIAIIGILASVVLASLNSARSKGADAAIKSNMANIRAQAAIYYDTANTYGVSMACSVSAAGTTSGTCTGLAASSTDMLKAAASAASATSTMISNAAGDAWAAVVPLKSGGGYCVDSTGASKASTTAYATNITVCP